MIPRISSSEFLSELKELRAHKLADATTSVPIFPLDFHARPRNDRNLIYDIFVNLILFLRYQQFT